MDYKSKFYSFLLQVLIFANFDKVSTYPAHCVNWQLVIPTCPCVAAIDEHGKEIPAVAVVDCSSKNLTAVPKKEKDFNRVLYELRLNNNQITTLPADAFQGIKIRHLDLTGNDLGEIDENAFRGTTDEMLVLDIQGNGHNLPQKNAIRHLINLEELTMMNYSVPHLKATEDQSYFLAYRHLRKLILNNWGIQIIAPSAFLTAGQLDPLRSLTLINQKLSVLPVDVLHETELRNLKQLQISNSKIQEISSYAFSNLHHIKEITLSNNEITTIDVDSFKNIGDTLEKIDLSHNLLGSSGTGNDLPNLKDLTNLKDLVLKSNQLVAIPKLERLGSGQPFKLDLSNNDITSVSANDLRNFTQRIKGLDLALNRIDQIDDQAFSGSSLLQSLVMNNQRGASTIPLRIPSTLTQASSSLTYIDFSGKIVDATSLWKVLGQLHQLKHAILHSIQLTSIPDFAFRNLTHLTELDLSHNAFTQITDRTFVGLRKLEEVRLKFIDVTSLPYCLFYMHTSKISLDLTYSNIRCDCSVKRLVDDIENGFVTFPSTQSTPTCSEDGSLLTSKSPSDFSTCVQLQCENYYRPTTPQPFSSPREKPPGDTDDNGSTLGTGAIVGGLVGGVVLLAIVAATLYLLLVRQRPKKSEDSARPDQPRQFASAELPSMSDGSTTVVNDKRKMGAMKVVAISDGQNRLPSTDGWMGKNHSTPLKDTYAYTPRDDGEYCEPIHKPFYSMHGNVNMAYENDHRPLPPTPERDMTPRHYSKHDRSGHYNDGFSGE